MKKIEDKLVMVKKGATKQMNKDSSNKSFLNLNNKEDSLKDIKKILDDCELVDKMKKIVEKIERKTNILPDEYILLVQYIFAVIVLIKYQRPGVISNMQLGEVLNSQVSGNYTCISVKEHTTGTKYPAVIPFNAFVNRIIYQSKTDIK